MTQSTPGNRPGTVDTSTGQIWKIAWPVLFSSLMYHMIGLTDTAFLGRVGEIELGAAAIGSVYVLALFIAGFGFTIGCQILIGQCNGARDYRGIGPVFRSSLGFLLALAAGLCLFSKLFTPKLMPLFIRSESVCDAALLYLDWRVYGLFFGFLSSLYRAFFVGVTRTRILTVNALIMVFSNVGLNYLLIFGKCGFPEMGIAGAAIASVAAEAISAGFYWLWFRLREDPDRYGFVGAKWFDRKLFGKIFDVSVWMMLQSFFAVAVWFYFFVVIEHLGERPLAVVNIVRSISSVLFILINSFGVTAGTLASNLVGAGEWRRVAPTAWKVLDAAALLTVPVLAMTGIFAHEALRCFTDSEAVVEAAYGTLYVALAGHLLQIPSNIWFNLVSGVGRTRAAMLIEVATLAIYTALVYYIGSHLRLNTAWCWTAEIQYQLSILSLSYLYLKYFWARNSKKILQS